MGATGTGFSGRTRSIQETNKSTLSFRRTPESSQIKHLDPGVRRGDDLFSASLSREWIDVVTGERQ
jgi:hypothetical protein